MSTIAQMMPGMEWIPVMVVVTIGGLICGLAALVLRVFGSGARAGASTGKTAVGVGIGSLVLFLLLEGSNLEVIGYAILASPIVPGAIALILPSTRKVRIALQVLFAIAAAGIVAAVAYYFLETSSPPGVHAETPAKYGFPPANAIANPFGLPPAIDAEGDAFVHSFDGPLLSATAVSVQLPFLSEFSGPQRELLVRHLATSAKWFLGKDIVNGQEKLVARRRFVEGGIWLNQLNGYFANDNAQFRIVLGIDGPVYAEDFKQNATFAHSDQGPVQLNSFGAQPGSPMKDSYLVVTSRSAALEVYEQSARTDRPFTPVALSRLNQEFQAVLSSATAKTRGFDPALMPPESIRRGSPDMHLLQYDEEDGTYQVYAYVNPGESGYVYLKAFQGRGDIRISGDEYFTRNSIEYIGWSADPQEQFFYNTEFDFDQPLISNSYTVRVEMWFVPSTGAAERKLFQKYFNVK